MKKRFLKDKNFGLPQGMQRDADEMLSLRALRRWGMGTHSFLSLYKDVEHFRKIGQESFIPFVETDQFILVAGEPVAEPDALMELMRGLKRLAVNRKKALGLLPSRAIPREVADALSLDRVYIGQEPIFDLQREANYGKSIRQAICRARKLGISVSEFVEGQASSQEDRKSIQTLCRRWSGSRELPPMQFLFTLNPLALSEHKRIFLAKESRGQVIAMLACSPIFGRNGWYLEDLLRVEEAPNGTTELLVTTVLEILRNDGYKMATLALAPLAGLSQHDDEHPWLNKLMRLAYKRLSFVYHFETLEYFKGKFKPDFWEPNYFYFYPRGVDLGLVDGLARAFLGDGIFSVVRHKFALWSNREETDERTKVVG